MISFEKFTLKNGLKVIVHQDKSTPIVAVNILYDVGARDEDENKTGFAHLFEHLMFGGSVNIPNFDEPLQRVGGTNNAFTSNDITNYYITLPKDNIETAVKKARLSALQSLLTQQQIVYNKSFINKDVEVLFEKEGRNVNQYIGRTIYNQSTFINSKEQLINKILNVKIINSTNFALESQPYEKH